MLACGREIENYVLEIFLNFKGFCFETRTCCTMVEGVALLCIDMQNDFCLPDAILCVKGAMGCLPKVMEAVNKARSKKVPVIWVVREHHPSGTRIGGYFDETRCVGVSSRAATKDNNFESSAKYSVFT